MTDKAPTPLIQGLLDLQARLVPCTPDVLLLKQAMDTIADLQRQLAEKRVVDREAAAEIIAREVCGVSKLSDLYADKQEWINDRGERHDINFPYQCDVLGAVDALLSSDIFGNVPSEDEIARVVEDAFARGEDGLVDSVSMVEAIRALIVGE